MDLNTILAEIPGGDPLVYQQAVERWNTLAKPLGSLGELETAIARIAALSGRPDVEIGQRALVVFCADNGVVAQGVSQSDHTVTEAVARALGEGRSTVSFMAEGLCCPVVPVDVGMSCEATPPGVQALRVRRGTEDMTIKPAMERDECLRVISVGFETANAAAARGCTLLLSGEMGIGNTTTSSAVLSVLLDESPERVAGKGAGLSQEGLDRKRKVIERAVSLHRPDASDPIDVLQKVGGLDLAALCGFYLGAAYSLTPVLLDGLISCTAALCAVRLCPAVKDALIASHCSQEPASALTLTALGLAPLISAGLRLGEGSGAVAALPLLDMALRVYHSKNTFHAIGIEPYRPL